MNVKKPLINQGLSLFYIKSCSSSKTFTPIFYGVSMQYLCGSFSNFSPPNLLFKEKGLQKDFTASPAKHRIDQPHTLLLDASLKRIPPAGIKPLIHDNGTFLFVKLRHHFASFFHNFIFSFRMHIS